jgi:5-methyltetrahydrofolate--homocysteine methyltransferase
MDGAMGTLIQSYGLEEADYRAERLKDHSHDLRGDSDLLSLVRPDIVPRSTALPDAGATRPTRSPPRIAQADYGSSTTCAR